MLKRGLKIKYFNFFPWVIFVKGIVRKGHYFAWRNLRPNPWHIWREGHFKGEILFSEASKIKKISIEGGRFDPKTTFHEPFMKILPFFSTRDMQDSHLNRQSDKWKHISKIILDKSMTEFPKKIPWSANRKALL